MDRFGSFRPRTNNTFTQDMNSPGQGRNEYRVDIVICIDGTSSMTPLVDEVKEQAKNFWAIYAEAMTNAGKIIADDGLRVRVIVFRDYACDAVPMDMSDFFTLNPDRPEEIEAFCAFVDKITACGGGDIPENALEAISLALKSEWNSEGGTSRRQAVLLFTDACTYDLREEKRSAHPNYPQGIPNSFEELKRVWERGDQELAPLYDPRFGRLVVFGPKNTGMTVNNPEEKKRVVNWCEIEEWRRTWVVDINSQEDIRRLQLDQALRILVSTFGIDN